MEFKYQSFLSSTLDAFEAVLSKNLNKLVTKVNYH